VVEHGLVRGPGQREHLAEQGLGDEELAPLGVVRREGQGAHLVRGRDGRLAPETGLERPEGVGDVLLGDETLEGTPVPGVPQTLGLLLGQDPASLQGKNRVNGGESQLILVVRDQTGNQRGTTRAASSLGTHFLHQ
jgi:hypothetical protein